MNSLTMFQILHSEPCSGCKNLIMEYYNSKEDDDFPHLFYYALCPQCGKLIKLQ